MTDAMGAEVTVLLERVNRQRSTEELNRLVRFAVEQLGDEPPKLTSPKGFNLSAEFFGLAKLQRGEALILVKAPLDVLRASEASVGNCLCFLTEELSKDQLLMLAHVMTQFEAPSIGFM